MNHCNYERMYMQYMTNMMYLQFPCYSNDVVKQYVTLYTDINACGARVQLTQGRKTFVPWVPLEQYTQRDCCMDENHITCVEHMNTPFW